MYIINIPYIIIINICLSTETHCYYANLLSAHARLCYHGHQSQIETICFLVNKKLVAEALLGISINANIFFLGFKV